MIYINKLINTDGRLERTIDPVFCKSATVKVSSTGKEYDIDVFPEAYGVFTYGGNLRYMSFKDYEIKFLDLIDIEMTQEENDIFHGFMILYPLDDLVSIFYNVGMYAQLFMSLFDVFSTACIYNRELLREDYFYFSTLNDYHNYRNYRFKITDKVRALITKARVLG